MIELIARGVLVLIVLGAAMLFTAALVDALFDED